jgi:hypothetical protein
MPNICTICKHPEREQIGEMLADGKSLRDIACQFSVGRGAVNRHQRCIAQALVKLRQDREIKSGETLLEKLDYYESIARSYLTDKETAMPALDRCHRQVDLRAKLTGEYQRKQENKLDAPNNNEISLEAYALLFASRTLEENLEQLHAIYDAPDENSRRDAIRAAIEYDAAVGEVWERATEIVSKRVM